MGLLVLLLACGKEADHTPQLDVGEFEPIVSQFEQQSANNGVPAKVTDLRIRFGRMDSPYDRAICEINPGETPTITVKKSAWELLSAEEREALLFHELGHCVLRRHHVTGKVNGVPVSLMYPYALDRLTYLENQRHYIRELVSRSGDF